MKLCVYVLCGLWYLVVEWMLLKWETVLRWNANILVFGDGL